MRVLPTVAFSALTLIATVSVAGLNPPPTTALGGYKSYELKPLLVSDELKSTETGQKATAKIQEHVDARLKPIVEGWNKMAEGEANGKTLVFEPSVADLRFINGAKRFWAGALAGKSHVVMHMKIVEQPGDKVIAEPEFYQHSGGMAGAWTMGAHDNGMLLRVVELSSEYLSANYQGAVGGRSGREEEEKEKK